MKLSCFILFNFEDCKTFIPLAGVCQNFRVSFSVMCKTRARPSERHIDSHLPHLSFTHAGTQAMSHHNHLVRLYVFVDRSNRHPCHHMISRKCPGIFGDAWR
jgi:hypothetical protein